MTTLLVHGCYDKQTLTTLIKSGATELSFDLRGRSANLIPWRDLSEILNVLPAQKIFLTFENDRRETIYSFLNLLKSSSHEVVIVLRDQQELLYYQQLALPFYWMFHPEGDWRGIFNLSHLKGIFLPLKWQNVFQSQTDLWQTIDRRDIDVYLHADNFSQTASLTLGNEVKLSLDLTSEVEASYRSVDQVKLREMKIWSKLNENSARQ